MERSGNNIEGKIRQLVNELNPLLLTHSIFEYIFYFLAIPIILTLIFILPVGIKYEFFILPSYDFIFPNCILYSWTHNEFNHYFGNLTSYLLVIFVILNYESKKERFWAISLFLFLFYFFFEIAILIFLSIIHPHLPNVLQSMLGFSGIISGLMGYLFILFFFFLKENYEIDFNLFSVALIGNLLIAIYNLQVRNSSHMIDYILFILVLLALIFFIWFYRNAIYRVTSQVTAFLKTYNDRKIIFNLYWIFISAMMIVFYIFPFISLIAGNSVSETKTTNILAHSIGFFLGLLAFYLHTSFFNGFGQIFRKFE